MILNALIGGYKFKSTENVMLDMDYKRTYTSISLARAANVDLNPQIQEKYLQTYSGLLLSKILEKKVSAEKLRQLFGEYSLLYHVASSK